MRMGEWGQVWLYGLPSTPLLPLRPNTCFESVFLLGTRGGNGDRPHFFLSYLSSCIFQACPQTKNRLAVFVLHCFQKKSKRGIATPKEDMDIIHAGLKIAEAYVKVLRK